MNKNNLPLRPFQREALVNKILHGMETNPRYRKHVEKKLLEIAWKRYSNESQT